MFYSNIWKTKIWKKIFYLIKFPILRIYNNDVPPNIKWIIIYRTPNLDKNAFQ